MCDELRIPYPAGTSSAKELVDRLHRHLLEAHTAGRRTVLIVDEAQNLVARGAGGGPPPHEPRDHPGEAAPGDPDRPARAGGDPGSAEAPPARSADHGSLPPRAALAGGDARVRPPPARRGGPRPAGVHRAGPAVAAPPVAWHSPPHQRHRRPRPPGRLHAGALPGRCRDRAARGGRGAGRILPPPWPRWARRAAAAALVAATGGVGLVLLVPGELGRDEPAGRTPCRGRPAPR